MECVVTGLCPVWTGQRPVTHILYPDSVPELPEVETIARGLHTRVAGDTVESVWIGSRQQPLKSPAGVIATTLEGKRIVRVHRAGKHIVFDLEGERTSEERHTCCSRPDAASRVSTAECAVGRPSRHDWAHGGFGTCGGNRQAHSPDRQASVGARTAVYRSPDVWQTERPYMVASIPVEWSHWR